MFALRYLLVAAVCVSSNKEVSKKFYLVIFNRLYFELIFVMLNQLRCKTTCRFDLKFSVPSSKFAATISIS